MRIKAYKCHVCKSISEQEHEFQLSICESGFEVTAIGLIPDYQPSVCSDDCVRASLEHWLTTRKSKQQEQEVA